jgi:hypothetical protein
MQTQEHSPFGPGEARGAQETRFAQGGQEWLCHGLYVRMPFGGGVGWSLRFSV